MPQARDLGVIDGAQYSLGNGINNLTRIVGGSLASGDVWEPTRWKKESGLSLLGTVAGTLYAQALAINDAGQIIGLDQTGTSDLSWYTAPGIGLKFFKGLGGKVTYARSINQAGVIAGSAEDMTNTTHAVMWPTPASKPVVFAPEAAAAYGINNLGQIVGLGYFP